jgi:hypothetical protein
MNLRSGNFVWPERKDAIPDANARAHSVDARTVAEARLGHCETRNGCEKMFAFLPFVILL